MRVWSRKRGRLRGDERSADEKEEEEEEEIRNGEERNGEIKGISCRRPDEPDEMEKMFENIKVAGYDDYKN